MNMVDKGEMGMTLRFLQGTNIVLILQKVAGHPTPREFSQAQRRLIFVTNIGSGGNEGWHLQKFRFA